MDLHERRKVGKTRLELPILGLGGAPLGNDRRVVPEAQALAAIEAAWEAGIRYFDVAPQYGHGLAEHRFGHVLREHAREEFILSTKVGRILTPRKGGREDARQFKRPLAFDYHYDYSYDGIMRSVEDSLQRLGIQRADILLIHNLDADNLPERHEEFFRQAMDSGYRALDKLRREGTISAFGVGNNHWQMCKRFAEAGEFDCFMIATRSCYTLLQQETLDEFLPLCVQRNISILIGGPYNSGILAKGTAAGADFNYASPPAAILDRVRRMEAVCERHGVPLQAAALQFPLAHPAVVSVVPGARSREQVERTVAALAHPIPGDLWAELKAEKLIRADAPTP